MRATFPKILKKGDTIGVMSPSSSGSQAVLRKGAAFLERNGYRVVMHPQNAFQAGHLAGSDKDKLTALMDMFADPAIDAIMCARGGNGAVRLLDGIDYRLIRKNPKPFIGYSDITFLLQAIYRKCGLVTYHGPTLSSFGRDFDARTADNFFALLENRRAVTRLHVSQAQILVAGKAEGILVGGNMTMLQNLIATPFDWTADKAILFIEETDEVLYRIDRMMHHFRLAGKFQNLAAVIVGELIDVPDGETSFMRRGEKPYGHDIRQILLHNLPPGIPVCIDFPCAHGKYITTFPIGAATKIRFDKNGASLAFMRT